MDTTSPAPPVDLPFPSRLNPHVESLGRELEQWVSAAGCLPGTGLSDLRLERLAGRMYPTAPPAVLDLAGRFLVWLFLYDDYFDPGAPGDHPEHASAIVEDIADVIRGAPAAGEDRPVVALLRQWCARAVSRTPGTWWRRCCADLRQVAGSFADEVTLRSRGLSPEPAAYLAHRRFSGGWGVLTDLVELTDDDDLPEPLRRSEEFQHLRWVAGDVTCTINDLLSFGKELCAGESHNLVLILRRTEGCDLAEAVHLARQWTAGRLAEYLRTRDRLRRSCRMAERNLFDRYATGLEGLMRGSLDWSLESSRYRQAPPAASGVTEKHHAST